VRISFGILYSLFYFWLIFFHGVSAWWLLLPVHYLIGPVQGATVNWCGHKYGYRNFDNGDHSRNTGNIGFFLFGELFQNNHHRYPDSPNFAKRWFELDPTYFILKILNGIKVIRFKKEKEI
jgi:stearoyl-CoA desaturase (delta-9 desaturase)